MSTTSILRALSALAPAPTRPQALDAADMLWLGMTPNRSGMRNDPFVLQVGNGEIQMTLPAIDVVGVDGTIIGATDQLIGDTKARATLNGQTNLPVSWITAVGWASDAHAGDAPFVTPVLHTWAVANRRGFELGNLIGALDPSWTLRRVSDWYLVPPVADEHLGAALADAIPWCGVVGYPVAGDRQLASSPSLQGWLRDLAGATGWRITTTTGRHPQAVATAMAKSGHVSPGDVTICVGFALLPTSARHTTGSSAALTAWSERAGIDDTAFAALVSPPEDRAAPAHDDAHDDAEELTSHVQLTAAQRAVARSARTAPVTVVSGAPGTGKTHTIAAICADAVARGESVLVGTRTLEAASVVADLLARQPGPVPLRFGSPDSLRDAFAEIERRLANQDTAGSRLADEAQADFETLTGDIVDILGTLASIDDAAGGSPRLAAARQRVPGCFAPGADLDRVDTLLDRAINAPGLLGTAVGSLRRRRRAAAKLAALVEAPCTTEEERNIVAAAARLARAQRSVDDAPALAETLQGAWPAWEEAEQARRYWTGKALDHLIVGRLGSPAARAALGTINTALRSGLGARQRLLSTIERRAFRDAAPIWLGTLGEIERLLPPTARWFDLVVIDEASQVDLTLAAPALLRGARCVVLGDPRQLRHVSFVGDDEMQEAFADEGLAGELGRLDVRRNSVFDIAAGVAPVSWLDEHHRSLPHLVQFSLDEFYDRNVAIATRFPTTECRDCIEVVSPRAADPRHADPVRAVVQRLRELQRAGADNVGVITPLRELADRLQEAVLAELGPDAISAMHLMVTTVHGFQGAERRHMIVVPGIDADSPAGRRRFVEDRNLFNVMVSRARQRMDVVTDVEPDDRTMLGRFVQWSHQPPPPAPSDTPGDGPALRLGKAFGDAGVEVRYHYPVGRHHVDVVVRVGERVLGVVCGVHPDGPDAHIDRHLALRHTGWRLVDLVPALDDAAMAAQAIEIAGDLRA